MLKRKDAIEVGKLDEAAFEAAQSELEGGRMCQHCQHDFGVLCPNVC